MGVLTDVRNRGVKDVFFLLCDGLKGLPEVVGNVWPLTTVQTCIIHLIRNTFAAGVPAALGCIQAGCEAGLHRGERPGRRPTTWPSGGASGTRALIRLRDNARKQFVPSLDNYLETIIRSTDESSSSRRQVCGFLGLPMADEDLVGPLGLFDDSVLFEALLRVVVRGAGHAEVAAPRRGPRGQLELASFVDDQPGPREDVVLVFGDQVPGQDGQFPGGRPWPITVVSGMDMTVQYHFIYLKTLSDRTAIEPADMGMGEPDPNDLDAPYVAPSPPDGAVIMCRSDWGPVKVIVAISADAFDVVSAPDLAQLDRDWQGVITLRDSAFDINTFDDAFFDHVLTRAGDHPVRVSWRYDHSRTITDENGPTPYQEYVIIRFANQGETR